jgi:hypothetical protein
VSDRREWLSQWCPECRAAPGARCRLKWWKSSGSRGAGHLHVARGWRERPCRACGASAGEPCRTPSGREASRVHVARLRPGRYELLSRGAVWDELERRNATIAVVPFSGRAGKGGSTGTITLSRVEHDELIDVERWTSRDELAYALEAPVWDRYGLFAGQPLIRGDVIWTLETRSVVIVGIRGDERFEEIVA